MSCVKAQDTNILQEISIIGKAQGTTYLIKYYSTDTLVHKIQIDSLLDVIDLSMSTYRSESLITAFNKTATREIQMDKPMKDVIQASFKYYKKTKGAFDITVMPLVKLWGFGPNGFSKNPSTHEIDSVLSYVGMKHLKTKKNTLIKKKENVSIDLNGIAQGYTVDVLAKYLSQMGIKQFIVELGGEIRTKGTKPQGKFLIEIQRPYQQKEKSTYKITLENLAITTSGTYEKQRYFNGKMISHHINPFTGYPLENSIVSVTVIAKTAMEADALDNYFMSLTPQKAIQAAEKMKNIEIYLIYNENNVLKELQTSKFNKYIYN